LLILDWRLLIETRSTNSLIVNQQSKINNGNFSRPSSRNHVAGQYVATAASAVQAKPKASAISTDLTPQKPDANTAAASE
jgi:hypothetical protein